MLRQIQTVFQSFYFAGRLGRCVQHPDIRDAVQAIMRHIIVFVIVSDEVIPSVHRRHLIGIDDVFPYFAHTVSARMYLFVCAIGEIMERYLPAAGDCFVQRFNGEKQLPVFGGCICKRADVSHSCPKIAVGKPFQLFHQLPALTVRYVLGKQQPVDQQPQFPVGEIMYEVKVG